MKITEKKYLTPFMLITLLFFLWGFARAILDVLNKHFQDNLHITISQSAWVQVTMFLGYFLMALPAGVFIRRYGYRQGVVFGLVLFGIGSLCFIPSSTFLGFLLCLFVIGCGLTFLETSANPYVTELGAPETSSSRLNLAQTFNGMGCFMATLIVGQFLYRDGADIGDVSVPYTIMGVFVLLIAFVFSRVQLPELSEDTPSNVPDTIGGVLRNKMFVFGLLALLAYEVAEISINSYFVTFVTEVGWMNKMTASRIVSLALVIFMISRFIGSWMMRYMKAELLLLIYAVGTVASMLLTLLDFGMISLISLVSTYFFEAIMFPTIFSLAVSGLGANKKSASSLLMMTPIGGCGFLLMGWIADQGNLFVPFMIPLFAFCVVAAYAMIKVRNASH